jgi:cell division protein FtsA
VFSIFQNDRSQRPQQSAPDSANVIFVFDIGSANVRLAAGQVSPDLQVKILGYCEKPSQGVSRGAVTDIEKLSAVLAQLVDEFSNRYSFNLRSCLVGVPGVFIKSSNEAGSSTVQNGIVSEADKVRAIENARAAVNIAESDFRIIHTIQQKYITETSNEVENPVGQYARRLQVSVHIIGLRRAHELNVRHVLERLASDFRASDFVFSGIAASDAVLKEGDKEIGVCLINIGAGTVDVAVYDSKRLLLTFGFDDGGNTITWNIAKSFGVPLSLAEQIKRYGNADPRYLTEQELNVDAVKIESGEPGEERVVRISEISYIINKCLNNIFRRISDTIQRMVNDGSVGEGMRQVNMAAGFVLTGGVARTRDIDKVLQDNMQYGTSNFGQEPASVKICVGIPRGVSAADEETARLMADPDKAVVVGLIRSGYRISVERQTQGRREEEKKGGVTGAARRVWEWLRSEM